MLLIALGATAVAVPFAREEERAATLRQQLAAVRAKAEAAQRVEKDIATQTQEANFLADRKRNGASALAILDGADPARPGRHLSRQRAVHRRAGADRRIVELRLGPARPDREVGALRKAEFRSPVTPDQASGPSIS